MGELVRYLSKISKNYDIYIVVVVNRYGNTAERVIDENFEKIAYDIGESAVISKLINERGRRQAEEKFDIKPRDRRPVLIITQDHPNEWTDGMPAIKVQLGRIENEDEIRNLLFELSRLISSDDFGGAKWLVRKNKVKRLAKKLPVIVEIVGLIEGLTS